MKRKTWISRVPKVCDICSKQIDNVFVDGRIKHSTYWVIMCPLCFSKHGAGLGFGFGQVYVKENDGVFYQKIT